MASKCLYIFVVVFTFTAVSVWNNTFMFTFILGLLIRMIYDCVHFVTTILNRLSLDLFCNLLPFTFTMYINSSLYLLITK